MPFSAKVNRHEPTALAAGAGAPLPSGESENRGAALSPSSAKEPSSSGPSPAEPALGDAQSQLLHQLKPSLRWAGFTTEGRIPSSAEKSSDSLVA